MCGEGLEVTTEPDNAHDRRAMTLLRSRGSEKFVLDMSLENFQEFSGIS